MKIFYFIFLLFLASCSEENWEFADFQNCEAHHKMKTHVSPSGDYLLEIPINWKPFYQTTDSSNLVFEVDANLDSNYDTNSLVLFSVFAYKSDNFSDPEKEFKLGVKKLFEKYSGLKNLESGSTDILGNESYYLHTEETESENVKYHDLYFQLRNEIDSNYYILQLHAAADKNIKRNMCLLLDIAKSFRIIGKHR